MHAELTSWAVVLAGGASRRFGSDKLEARLGRDRLLDHAIRDLPTDARLILVGPVRQGLATDRLISYVREEPPGGGPAAALVAGLIAVTESAAAGDLVLVLPGDAPGAGRAATRLRERLHHDSTAEAVVAVTAGERVQPLQLALRLSAAERLIRTSGPDRGAGRSARVLIAALGESLQQLALEPALCADIDTPADLARWPETDG